jgi:hypothetical protein
MHCEAGRKFPPRQTILSRAAERLNSHFDIGYSLIDPQLSE